MYVRFIVVSLIVGFFGGKTTWGYYARDTGELKNIDYDQLGPPDQEDENNGRPGEQQGTVVHHRRYRVKRSDSPQFLKPPAKHYLTLQEGAQPVVPSEERYDAGSEVEESNPKQAYEASLGSAVAL